MKSLDFKPLDDLYTKIDELKQLSEESLDLTADLKPLKNELKK